MKLFTRRSTLLSVLLLLVSFQGESAFAAKTTCSLKDAYGTYYNGSGINEELATADAVKACKKDSGLFSSAAKCMDGYISVECQTEGTEVWSCTLTDAYGTGKYIGTGPSEDLASDSAYSECQKKRSALESVAKCYPNYIKSIKCDKSN